MKSLVVQEHLQTLYDAYESKLSAYCQKVFDQEVKPYLIKNDLRFICGMGMWAIRKHDSYHDARVPDLIYNILECEICTNSGWQSLGSFLHDYDPREDNK